MLRENKDMHYYFLPKHKLISKLLEYIFHNYLNFNIMKLNNQTLSFDYNTLRSEKFTEPWQINFNTFCKENKKKNPIKISSYY